MSPPLDPDNPYLEEAHPLTKTGQDFRYGCWNVNRPAETFHESPSGWTNYGIRILILVRSEWKNNGCHHDARFKDPACQDCKYAVSSP